MTKLTTELAQELKVLERLAERINNNAIAKGFYETLEGELVVDDNLVGMKLALVHSEVTEVLEAVRKGQGEEAIADEFADVFIRLLDLWHVIASTEIYGSLPRLHDAVAAKVEKNEARPHKHGRRF